MTPQLCLGTAQFGLAYGITNAAGQVQESAVAPLLLQAQEAGIRWLDTAQAYGNAEAVLGRQAGRKAALWGALCGTLPDLDVLIPFGGPVADFTYHRSFSHSLVMMVLATPVIAWFIQKLHPAESRHRRRWLTLVFLALATHALLDSCTIYGTQLFWPLSDYPASWGFVFIIDPAFTIPLAIGVAAAIVLRHPPGLGHVINSLALGVSVVYLAWGCSAKQYALRVAERSLAEQGLQYRDVVVLAAPLNTLLWRVVAMQDESYLVGWYSLLDPDGSVRFTSYPSEISWLRGLEDHWPVQRLQWFTKGFYRVSRVDEDIVITDLRMGLEGAYAFSFKVGVAGSPHARPVTDEARTEIRDFSGIKRVFSRISDPQVALD